MSSAGVQDDFTPAGKINTDSVAARQNRVRSDVAAKFI
jgi:hypothetical protein